MVEAWKWKFCKISWIVIFAVLTLLYHEEESDPVPVAGVCWSWPACREHCLMPSCRPAPKLFIYWGGGGWYYTTYYTGSARSFIFKNQFSFIMDFSFNYRNIFKSVCNSRHKEAFSLYKKHQQGERKIVKLETAKIVFSVLLCTESSPLLYRLCMMVCWCCLLSVLISACASTQMTTASGSAARWPATVPSPTIDTNHAVGLN